MVAYSTFRHMAVGNREQVGLVGMWSVNPFTPKFENYILPTLLKRTVLVR